MTPDSLISLTTRCHELRHSSCEEKWSAEHDCRRVGCDSTPYRSLGCHNHVLCGESAKASRLLEKTKCRVHSNGPSTVSSTCCFHADSSRLPLTRFVQDIVNWFSRQNINKRTHKLMMHENLRMVNWLFGQRVTQFINGFMLPFLNVRDYWYRYKWQHRGSPHLHGLLRLERAPDCSDLVLVDWNQTKPPIKPNRTNPQWSVWPTSFVQGRLILVSLLGQVY